MDHVISVKADQLTAQQVSDWSRLQQQNREFDSPYFRPEFTRAVASVRDDVEVAILERHGQSIGFLPYQRRSFNRGRPGGGRLSDFQGFIVQKEENWSAEDLLGGCGLRVWEFDHLLATQQPFLAGCAQTDQSPFIDVSQGFDKYRSDQRAAGKKELINIGRKYRKMEREVGPLRFEAHTTDARVFDQLLNWKSTQYQQSQTTNVFSYDWTVELLKHILTEQNEAFSGMLSTLHVGDRLIAIHLGMRSNRVFHYWFPAYNVEFRRYSPGTMLLIEIAKAAEALGIERIDLGKGPESYKASLMSGSIAVAEGLIDRNPVARTYRQTWHRTRNWMKASRLCTPVVMFAQAIRPLRQRLSYH